MKRLLIDNYDNTIKLGYISIILFAISLFLGLFFKKMYGTINDNWGPITLIIAIIGLAFYITS